MYVFESFIMSIVIFTKILSWYVFISKRAILFESENVFNKKLFLNEIRRNCGNPQFCFFEIVLVKIILWHNNCAIIMAFGYRGGEVRRATVFVGKTESVRFFKLTV